MERPFTLLGLQQVAIGSKDRDKLRHLWIDMLGLEVKGQFRSEKENVDEDICSLGKKPFEVEVDLMVPVDEEKKPKVNDPPLNHIGFWVDDLKSAVTWLTEKGMRFTPGGIRRGASGHDVVFIHPKANQDFPLCGEGVLIELVQAPDELIEIHKKFLYNPS